MKSKKLMTKLTMFIVAGTTFIGSSTAVFAKTYQRPGCWYPIINRPGNGSGNTGNGSDNNGSGNNGSDNENTDHDNVVIDKQTSYENQVLEIVNKERANYNLSALTMDESVRKVARLKSEDMSKNNYFSHTSPTYGTPFEMLKSYGITYKSAAENIAQGYISPEDVVTGWMNSSGHRANILSTKYTKLGVGYVANGNYWTQMFIG